LTISTVLTHHEIIIPLADQDVYATLAILDDSGSHFNQAGENPMALSFSVGDDLVFQIESGFGLLRVLAIEERDGETAWHILVYEDFYPDVESAEAALVSREGSELAVRNTHLALTEHALEKTPAARLGNRPVTEQELEAYREWKVKSGEVFDRSVLLMLGLR